MQGHMYACVAWLVHSCSRPLFGGAVRRGLAKILVACVPQAMLAGVVGESALLRFAGVRGMTCEIIKSQRLDRLERVRHGQVAQGHLLPDCTMTPVSWAQNHQTVK